jgi:hypothetical protein
LPTHDSRFSVKQQNRFSDQTILEDDGASSEIGSYDYRPLDNPAMRLKGGDTFGEINSYRNRSEFDYSQ